jgi:hypothetical protein
MGNVQGLKYLPVTDASGTGGGGVGAAGMVYYEGNSIIKLQIQVATYDFELSAGNCHR